MPALARGVGILLLCLATCGQAQARCNVPREARSWLAGHSGWRMVDLADLNPDDRSLWRKAYRGACPGYARARLDGSGVVHVAVAMLSAGRGARVERIMLFHGSNRPPRLMTSYHVQNLGVVRRLGPGRFGDVTDDRIVRNRHDSIQVEFLETSSQLFYLSAGQLKNIWTSD